MQNGFNRLRSTFFALCKGLNTPRALAAWILFRNQEYLQLVSLEVRAIDYNDSESFRRDYLVTEFLSKAKFLDLGVSRKETALRSFKESESRCLETNRRLRRFAESPIGHLRENAIMSMATRKIGAVLGNVSSIDWARCMWGPGNTFSLKGSVSLGDKLLEERISITPSALRYFSPIFGSDILWAQARGIEASAPFSPLSCEFDVVRGCRVTVVPKNAKTDRTIAIEPTGNIFLQKAIGSHIRHRLKKVGINLNDQTTNQRLARWGSKYGHLATLDLRQASDSVSRLLVWDLLPLEWASLLNDLRSSWYFMDGRWSYAEKFSSMGNGFTFELESLIFWALTSSVAEYLGQNATHVSVYGDDIICPTECAPLLIEVLDFVGFETNQKKTFVTTPFRESCGAHYFKGFDVTPVYQKELPDRREEVYRLANRLRRYSNCNYGGGLPGGPLISAWHACLLDFEVKHVLPEGDESDDGLLLSREELLSDRYSRLITVDHHTSSLRFPVYRYKSISKRGSHFANYYFWHRFRDNRPEEHHEVSSRPSRVEYDLAPRKIDAWTVRGRGRWITSKSHRFSVST